MTAGRAVLVLVLMVVAAVPTVFGLNLVSYAVGSPDSPRFYVGLLAVLALCLTAVLLHAAGSLLNGLGWRPPLAVPVLGALSLAALVAVSVPREYDAGTPRRLLVLAAVGVIAGGTALSARAPARAVPVGLGALGAFYAVCLMLDGASLLPSAGGPPPVVSEPREPVPVLPPPPARG